MLEYKKVFDLYVFLMGVVEIMSKKKLEEIEFKLSVEEFLSGAILKANLLIKRISSNTGRKNHSKC